MNQQQTVTPRKSFDVSQFAYFHTYTCYFQYLSAFTQAKRSALRVHGRCTYDERGSLDTSHLQWSPFWGKAPTGVVKIAAEKVAGAAVFAANAIILQM